MAERLNAIALRAIRLREQPRGFESSSLREPPAARGRIRASVALIAAALLLGVSAAGADGAEETTYLSGGLRLKAHLARPAREGPFPVVVYNHGGFGGMIGGAPEETCDALAQAGYIGFSPVRREEISLAGNLQDVMAAVDHAKGLPGADPKRIALMGFSRGGLLALWAAARRDDLKVVVLMAPAPGRGQIDQVLDQAERVSAPVLILVAENDKSPADHAAIARAILDALAAEGKQVMLIVYPPYGSDGHRMFFKVGSYWEDVLTFLRRRL